MKLYRKCIYALLAVLLPAACTPEGTPGGDDGGDGGDDKPQEKMYEVGDIYDNGFIRGMVFTVDETGEHGMMMSLGDTVTVWSYAYEEAMGSFPTDGLSNTKAVFGMDNWRNNYPGFLWCYNMNVMGIDRWFIPNPYELYQLYSVYVLDKDGFNNMLEAAGGVPVRDEVYWTSNESGQEIAIPFDMSVGENVFYPTDMDKRKEYRFRAFCSF